ncbi:MAG: ABC transporter substrate-binding protein [Bacteroidota bacterium]
MEKLSLALDWTPNINHIGFFIAQEKGFYQDLGLDVQILDPAVDDYQVTPAKKVELGEANFALCPTESIISYRTKETPFKLIAIAAILQEDLSAIVVKNENGINGPKDLDGKLYSSYQARYEDEIVKQMIRNDGGTGDIKIDYPAKLGIWDTVLDGSFDATWIFLNWEGVEAEALDVDLSYFKMKDYGIPYSYSPVIAANETTITINKDACAHFLAATKKGYLYSVDHPEESVALFKKFVPKKDEKIDLHKALTVSSPHFGNSESWGKLDKAVVGQFLAWIVERKLETQPISVPEIMTNELIGS